MVDLPKSDLSRAISSDPDRSWPLEIRVVASWGKNQSNHFVITKDEYFGLGAWGAPLNGERLMQRIEGLRRKKP